jgi:carbonic anhydrase
LVLLIGKEEQLGRLCELNVMRQTFHVCTSPVVQNAWDQGQEVAVYVVIYSLQDGKSVFIHFSSDLIAYKIHFLSN